MTDSIEILSRGCGELIGWRDPDENRSWIRDHKPRGLIDKRMSVRDAVQRFVADGGFLAIGGFGHVRVPMAVIYEIIRQGRRNLTLAGKTAVHDLDVLIGAGCISRVECAYSFGHELRGLSPAGRRKVEGGQVQVASEISNGGLQWRFLAGMMGLPFIPMRGLAGTDTFAKSSAIQVRDPWSGQPVTLVPAAYPDVALIHVHRCDRFGNAQVDGIPVEDFELARAARRVIVSAEEVVDEEVTRRDPRQTLIPFYVVDAVCHVPYGAHPCQMPYCYYFDEEHIAKWLSLAVTEEGAQDYLDRYVHGVDDFSGYLERVGGEVRLAQLGRLERLERPEGNGAGVPASGEGGR